MNTLSAVVGIIIYLLNLIVYLVIAQAILSWLVAFNVVNLRNRFVEAVYTFLYRITDPMLRPIRRVLPDLGGIDLSPMVLILLIFVIQRLLPAVLQDTGMI